MYSKILVSFVLFAAVLLGVISHVQAEESASARALPAVIDVLPDPLPLDMSETPALVQTKHFTISRHSRAAKPAERAIAGATMSQDRVWKCGEPSALMSDAVATVRVCGWVSR